MLQNELKFSQISLNPLAVGCKSWSKAAWELQIAYPKLLEKLCKPPQEDIQIFV
jgi:hypothetical protein